MGPNKLIRGFATKYRVRLKRFDFGEIVIAGKLGHIYEFDDNVLGVLFMPHEWSPRLWRNAQRKFKDAGFVIVQDGDWEGAATFDPSNANQAKLALKLLRIKAKRNLSVSEREARQRRIGLLNADRRLASSTHVKNDIVAL